MRSGCCARVVKGHAAALLRNVMNSRRLICRPRGFGQGIVPVQMSVVKGCRMSALGQKRTWRSQISISALPPKADITRHHLDVRFGALRFCGNKFQYPNWGTLLAHDGFLVIA
jgi:hypothetical protein